MRVSIAGRPPASANSGIRYFPEGCTLASTGTCRPMASKSSSVKLAPARRASAIRWMAALVEPPSARQAFAALRNEASQRMSPGLMSSHTIWTMRRPAAAAIWCPRESMAGTDELPASDMPSTSASAVIVDAVPMTLQVPGELHNFCSTVCQSSSDSLPASSSGAQRKPPVPLPKRSPRKVAPMVKPAGEKMVGMFMLMAPISRPGVVLSQPPSRIAPSMGWQRSSSSVSIARKLR